MAKIFVFVAMIVATLVDTEGYSNGAPESACLMMVPQHGVAQQSTPAPYTITTNTKTVKAGETLQVTIKGKSAQDTIRGLLLQARQGEIPVGKFTVDPKDNFAKTLSCGSSDKSRAKPVEGQVTNAVTHRKHPEKEDKNSVTYTWAAPKNFNGQIRFRATVAYNGGVFWTGVQSDTVKIN